jgi:hypothetical protein
MPNATAPNKKWYVFDAHDCFEHCDNGTAAGLAASSLVAQGMEGVHTVCMTQAQFEHYCKHDDLKAALKM